VKTLRICFLMVAITLFCQFSCLSETLETRQVLISVLEKAMAQHDTFELKIGDLNEPVEDSILVSSISLKGTGVVVEGLKFRNLELSFGRTEISLSALLNEGKVRILKSETGSVVDMEITEGDLNTFLRNEAERLKIQEPLVELREEGNLLFRGRCHWWFADASFSTLGKFELRGDKEIHFTPSRVAISEMSMPSFMVAKLVRRINPILSLQKFPLGISLGGIEIRKGLLRIFSLQLPGPALVNQPASVPRRGIKNV